MVLEDMQFNVYMHATYNSELRNYIKIIKYQWIAQNVLFFTLFVSVYLSAKKMDCTAMTQ